MQKGRNGVHVNLTLLAIQLRAQVFNTANDVSNLRMETFDSTDFSLIELCFQVFDAADDSFDLCVKALDATDSFLGHRMFLSRRPAVGLYRRLLSTRS